MNRSLSYTRPQHLVILVTGYLGVPATAQSTLQNADQRFTATYQAVQAVRRNSGGLRVLLAFTGDSSALNRLITACGVPIADAANFPQNTESIPSGKGLLEHQLICRALEYWELSNQDTLVVKLTAKYSIENFSHVLDFASKCKYPIFGWTHPGKSMVDSRCFFFRSQVYKDFCEILDQIDDRQGYYIEHALYNILLKLRIRPGLLSSRPLVFGLSGSSGAIVRTASWKRCIVYFMSLSRLWPK